MKRNEGLLCDTDPGRDTGPDSRGTGELEKVTPRRGKNVEIWTETRGTGREERLG